MSFDRERTEVDGWLCRKGIPHSLQDLYDDRTLCAGCTVELLELLQSSFSLETRTMAAGALLARKPSLRQKRKSVDVLLAIFREHMGRNDHCLSMLAMNALADNIGRDKVDEIGRMVLDERYGKLRTSLTHSLYTIGNPAAIEYLRQAARDPVTAAAALYRLARLKAKGTLELCQEALKDSRLSKEAREGIEETRRKLLRDKKQV